MKKYTIFTLLTLLILSCGLFSSKKEDESSKESLKNENLISSKPEEETLNNEPKEELSNNKPTDLPLIGIQQTKKDGSFIHKRESYDFSDKNWIFEVTKDNENGVIFTIMDKEKGFNKRDSDSPIRGVVLVLDQQESEINKFKNAMISGGTFKAENTVLTSNEKTDILVKKETNENDYVFFDLKINTGENDDKGRDKTEEVSFALSIEKIKEELKKIEQLLKKE